MIGLQAITQIHTLRNLPLASSEFVATLVLSCHLQVVMVVWEAGRLSAQ